MKKVVINFILPNKPNIVFAIKKYNNSGVVVLPTEKRLKGNKVEYKILDTKVFIPYTSIFTITELKDD